MVKGAREKYSLPVKLVCRAFSISVTFYDGKGKLNTENEEIASWHIRLTDNNRNWWI
jgi:hypothetical protein